MTLFRETFNWRSVLAQFLLWLMILVAPAYAQGLPNLPANEIWLAVGSGGEFGDTSASLGTRFLKKWGFLVTGVHNQDYDDDEVIDGPAPVANVTVIDEDGRTSPTYGIEGLYFANLGAGSIYLGAGAYVGTRCRVVASNLTGFTYCQDEDEDFTPGASLGVRYGKKITYGAEASTARGISLGIGYRW